MPQIITDENSFKVALANNDFISINCTFSAAETSLENKKAWLRLLLTYDTELSPFPLTPQRYQNFIANIHSLLTSNNISHPVINETIATLTTAEAQALLNIAMRAENLDFIYYF